MRRFLAVAGVAVLTTAAGVAVPIWPATAATCHQTLRLGLTPAKLVGGDRSTGTVRLHCRAGSHGATIWLHSADSGLRLPSSVRVASGKTTAQFTVRTSTVNSAQTDVIQAQLQQLKAYGRLLVQPAARISTLTLSKSTINTGQSTTGTVTLTGIAPDGGTTVYLGFDTRNGHVLIPESVTVKPHQSSANFSITTDSSHETTAGNVWASLNPALVWTGDTNGAVPSWLSVVPVEPGVSDFGPADGTTDYARPGHPLTAKVGLYGPAPKAGTVVSLTSSSPYATVPTTVTVPAGATSATFPVNAVEQPTRDLPVQLTASAYGVARGLLIKVSPAGNLRSLYMGNYFVESGGSTRVGITLSYGQPTDTVVSLTSSDPNVTTPATVTIPVGRTGSFFTINAASSMTHTEPVTLTATLGPEKISLTLTAGPNGPAKLQVPTSVPVGSQEEGRVELYTTPTADSVITLTSSDPHVVLPATIPVGPKGWNPYFILTTTGPLTSDITVTITATYNGQAISTHMIVTPS